MSRNPQKSFDFYFSKRTRQRGHFALRLAIIRLLSSENEIETYFASWPLFFSLPVHFSKCGADSLFIAQGRGHSCDGGGVITIDMKSHHKTSCFLSFLERVLFEKQGPRRRKRREVLLIPQWSRGGQISHISKFWNLNSLCVCFVAPASQRNGRVFCSS